MRLHFAMAGPVGAAMVPGFGWRSWSGEELVRIRPTNQRRPGRRHQNLPADYRLQSRTTHLRSPGANASGAGAATEGDPPGAGAGTQRILRIIRSPRSDRKYGGAHGRSGAWPGIFAGNGDAASRRALPIPAHADRRGTQCAGWLEDRRRYRILPGGGEMGIVQQLQISRRTFSQSQLETEQRRRIPTSIARELRRLSGPQGGRPPRRGRLDDPAGEHSDANRCRTASHQRHCGFQRGQRARLAALGSCGSILIYVQCRRECRDILPKRNHQNGGVYDVGAISQDASLLLWAGQRGRPRSLAVEHRSTGCLIGNPLRKTMLRLNRDRSSWQLALFLLLAVLAPSGSVLWFMNDAVREADPKPHRQSVTQAYREQLRLLRDHVDDWWKARAVALDVSAQDFPAALKAAGADSAILLDAKGSAIYPTLPAAAATDSTLGRGDWAHAESLERTPQRLNDAAGSMGAAWRNSKKIPTWPLAPRRRRSAAPGSRQAKRCGAGGYPAPEASREGS